MMPALTARPADDVNHPAKRSPMNLRNLPLLLFALFSTIMLGLAAGAIWMVATLYLQYPMPWLVMPIGAMLGWGIRQGVRNAGSVAACLAAVATALATIYVGMLMVAVQIAGSMGMALIDSLRTAGLGLLWQLTRSSLKASDIGWTVLAMALSAWIAWRPRRQRQHAQARR
jgi:hypothetical protein